MKTAITLLILSLAIMATKVRSQNPEQEVLMSVEGLHAGVIEIFREITAAAMRGNSMIGRIFQSTENENLPKVLGIIENMKADILGRRLTLERAQGYFGSLKAIMDQLRERLSMGTNMLPRDSAQQVWNYFNNGYSRMFAEAPKFYRYAQITQG